MSIIVFIKALAFIVCVVIKAIAFPFWLVDKLVTGIFKGIRYLCVGVTVLLLKLKRHVGKARERCRKRKEENCRKRVENRQKKRFERKAKRLKKKQKEKKKDRKRNPHDIEAFWGIKLKLYVSERDKVCIKLLKRIFWVCYTLVLRGYWRVRTTYQRIYWFLHSVYRKIYWALRPLLNRVYWKMRTTCQKIYWAARTMFNKIYWATRTVFNKIYWWGRTVYQRLYWWGRVKYEKAYWKYYAWSRKVYSRMITFQYLEVFFVFLRGYLGQQSSKIIYVPIIAVKEFVKKCSDSASFRVIEKGKLRTVCIPEYFEKSKVQLEQFESPHIYVAEIGGASVIGGSNVLIASDHLLNDDAYYDKEHRVDIRYSSIKKVIGGIALIEDTDIIDSYEKGICLVAAASFNYYHLIVEILSRLTFVDMCNEYRNYPILVDEIVLNIPQFKNALTHINKYNHPIIKIEKEKKYYIEQLIVPSSNVWMPTNIYDRNSIRTSDFMISETVLNNIRNAVGVWEETKPWRKIFISRKNVQAVRLKNEETVRNIFAQNGFEIIYAETMSFEQQVECFGQAACVIATSGAALTNTIFCQKGAIIGCIIPSYHRFYMYSTIAHLLELEPIFLDAEITELTPYAAADSFVLDEDYVKRYIEYIKTRIGD